MTQSLFIALYWYFFCLYFQTGPNSEEAQNQLVILASEIFSSLGKMVLENYPVKSIITDHALNNSHIDDFYKHLYFLLSESIYVAFIRFMPASNDIINEEIDEEDFNSGH